MLHEFIYSLQHLDPLLIYGAIFAIAFVENVFPPSPSDIVVVFAGSLVGIGQVDFVPSLAVATLGSTLGFISMYKIGDWFGKSILQRGKISFIPADLVHKVELWFVKYGYWIIVANRFLAGTRAVVSFVAGLSKMDLLKTSLLSFCSALLWNAILIGAGTYLGRNWEQIGFYLTTYSYLVTSIIVVVGFVLAARFIMSRNNRGKRA